MTREEFLNVFVRKKKIVRSVSLTLIAFFVGVLVFSGIFIYLNPKENVWDHIPYFVLGWLLAEAGTIGYFFAFAYGKEKLRLDEELCRDIIE